MQILLSLLDDIFKTKSSTSYVHFISISESAVDWPVEGQGTEGRGAK